MNTKPNPGSNEAIDQGCTCAVLDNHHGRGITINGKTEFWVDSACPIHGHVPMFAGREEEPE
jgi:hypothetical protein